ncbi:energy transducer TonB [Rhodocaloribacter sp.]
MQRGNVIEHPVEAANDYGQAPRPSQPTAAAPEPLQTPRRPQRQGFLHKKNPRANLRLYYGIYLEIGLILALAALIFLFRAPIRPDDEGFDIDLAQQEVVQIEEIKQTQQEAKPPPPPRPPVPVEVPNDVVLDDEELNLDATLDFDEPLAELPPPPAPKEEKKVEEPEPEIFVVVEEMPVLIGGLRGLQAKIHYPEMAKKAGVQGRVIVQFVVNEQGDVENATVIRGIGGGADEEALRVISAAKFKPGKQRGRPVKVRMSLPILFKLR